MLNLEQEKENLENVEVQELEGRGKGLIAKRDFKKGEIVFRVHGDVIHYSTDYSIPLNETDYIEPRLSGSVAQFMNHSCNANLYPSKDGRSYIAMRDIQAGEEVATNYGFLGHAFGEEKTIDGENSIYLDLTCHCNSEQCKGKIRGYDEFTPEEKVKYKNYVLPFLSANPV